MMCRHAANLFIVFALASLGFVPAFAQTKANVPTAQSVRLSPMEQYCAEEEELADRWIQWAAHKRHECALESDDLAARTACLQQHRNSLDQFEAEYREIYMSQVRNLRNDHPVVRRILQRLRSHKEAASVILERDDADPALLASRIKTECLATESRGTTNQRKR